MTDTASLFQWSPLAARNIDDSHTSETRSTTPPAVLDRLPVPIRWNANNHDVSLLTEDGDSAPTTLQDLGDSARLAAKVAGGHDAKYFVFFTIQDLRNLPSCTRNILPSPDKFRNTPSSVWSSLYAYVEHHRLMPAIVVT